MLPIDQAIQEMPMINARPSGLDISVEIAIGV